MLFTGNRESAGLLADPHNSIFVELGAGKGFLTTWWSPCWRISVIMPCCRQYGCCWTAVISRQQHLCGTGSRQRLLNSSCNYSEPSLSGLILCVAGNMDAAGLLSDPQNSIFVELGAGKGFLSAWLHQVCGAQELILLDRQGNFIKKVTRAT